MKPTDPKSLTESAAGVFTYRSYGLVIRSEIVLPEFDPATPGGAPVQVVIRRGAVALPEGVRALGAWFEFSDSGVRFWWQAVGGFAVSADGSEVTVEYGAGVSDDLIAFPLLGPVLSEVLRRQGLFVLHASSVAFEGQGLALMADKGTGKSTTATALLRAGARLLADDLVAIRPDQNSIVPGFGQVKLAEEALTQLPEGSAVPRPHVHDQIDKIRVLVPGLMAPEPVPARRLYVLVRGGGSEARIERPATGEMVPALLRFAYADRFGRAGPQGAEAARQFRDAVAVARHNAVRRLILPDGVTELDKVIAAIRADLGEAP
jgi:hypothetical protein